MALTAHDPFIRATYVTEPDTVHVGVTLNRRLTDAENDVLSKLVKKYNPVYSIVGDYIELACPYFAVAEELQNLATMLIEAEKRGAAIDDQMRRARQTGEEAIEQLMHGLDAIPPKE